MISSGAFGSAVVSRKPSISIVVAFGLQAVQMASSQVEQQVKDALSQVSHNTDLSTANNQLNAQVQPNPGSFLLSGKQFVSGVSVSAIVPLLCLLRVGDNLLLLVKLQV